MWSDKLIQLSNNEIFYLALIFSRIAASLMTLPGMGEAYVTPRLRLLIALFLSLVIYPSVTDNNISPIPNSFFAIFLNILAEIIIGLLLGIMARLLVSTIHSLGAIISTQSGLGSATIFDPSQGAASNLEGSFYNLLVLTLFFSLDIHYIFIDAVISSYKTFPLLAPLPVEDMSNLITSTVNNCFIITFKLASPFIAVGAVLFLGGGLLARLMPSIQIFFILLPLQISTIFMIIYVTLSFSVTWFMEYMAETISSWFN